MRARPSGYLIALDPARRTGGLLWSQSAAKAGTNILVCAPRHRVAAEQDQFSGVVASMMRVIVVVLTMTCCRQ
jgi:hypothetical protein